MEDEDLLISFDGDEASHDNQNETQEPAAKSSDLDLSQLSLAKGAPRHPRAWSTNGATGANATPLHAPRVFKTPRRVGQQTNSKPSSSRYQNALLNSKWAGEVSNTLVHWPQNSAADSPGGLHFQSVPTEPPDVAMADTDGRDYGRGGGGGYGRKRRRREDDDFDRRGPQRRRYEENLSVKVRRQILAIAENPIRRADEDIVAVAKIISENFNDEYFRNATSDLILQIILEQPFKIPFVAAIVLHTNQQKREFTQVFLESVGARVQMHLEAGEWRQFKLLVRFLGCINELFNGDGVLGLLEELFNRAADLQAVSSEDALGLELVKIIMLTIPYTIAFAGTDISSKVAELLEKTDIIASAPREVEILVKPYLELDAPGAPLQQSSLAMLQKQLQSEAEAGWTLAFMPRFVKPEAPLIDVDGSDTVPMHAFPTLTFPETINPGKTQLFPEVYFSLFADQDIETVPPTTNVASYLIRDALVDTINILDFNRSAAAQFLIDVDCYWAPETFAKRATPFDRLKELGEDKSTWKPEDLAVDAIFSQMLLLPIPEHKLVYYHSMITETCKIAPAAIAPSLGRAIRFLYRNMGVMDTELVFRFNDWFAHHLSNFDFRWKWAEWIDDFELPPVHPKKAFILGTLDKEIRLSFAKRIRDALPEQYSVLVPPIKDKDIPVYKYNNEVTPYSTEAKQILNHLKRKSPDFEIQAVIDSIHESETARDANVDPMLASTDAFVSSLCYLGSKSLSHALSYIERHRERLVSLAPVRHQVITSVVSYWHDVQPGVAVSLVDKLLNYTILTPASVIEWALAPDRLNGGRSLAKTWIYEMVSGTISKVAGRVRQIVAARMQRGLPAHQVEMLDTALREEMEAMRALFSTIDDAVAGVAEGSNDRMMEEEDGAGGKIGETEMSEEEAEILKLWGMKWRRVFSRKLAVEESVIAESVKLFPPAAEEDPVVTTDMNGNGVGNGVVGGPSDDPDVAEIL